MNQELATRRPAEVLDARPIRVLTAVARPIVPPPAGIIARVMSPADWPWSVVILLHLALAGAVVLPLYLLALYIGR